MDEVGHQLIEPTGKYFVFVLRLEDLDDDFELDEESRKALEEYINADEHAELETKQNVQLPKAALSKKPLSNSLPVIEEAEVEISEDVQEDMEDYINLDKEEEKIKSTKKALDMKSIKKRKLTITLETIPEVEEPLSPKLSLSWYAHSKLNNVHGRPRIPRTSNGPSLASLMASAKAADFKPESTTSSTRTLSDPKPQTIGLVHSMKLPSLAEFIASADPAGFPLPDPDADEISALDPNTYTGEIDITGAHIVRKYDYTHRHAFTVFWGRFEKRHDGGDERAAIERKMKKMVRTGESWLRLEVIFEETVRIKNWFDGVWKR